MRSVELQKLHAGQYPIAEGIRDHRRVIVRAGRRFGKTSLFERTACKYATQDKRVGWFGPTYKLNLPTYRRVLNTLRPKVQSASKIDQLIELKGGGCVEFWTLQDEDAGRSRYYDLVLIDEASLVQKGMREIWEQSIAPTLLDRGGKAIIGGTPKGINPDNYFYQACTDKKLGWIEYHAPTSANPVLDPNEVAKLRDEYPPLVYQQEYLADFVDWRGSAFFSQDSLLVDGKGYEFVTDRPDYVFAVIDTALKDGLEHDGTGVVYFAKSSLGGPPLVVLDWDVIQIQGSLLEQWLPSVSQRLEQLAVDCRAFRGSHGVWVEDKGSGTVLIQQAQRRDIPCEAIGGELVAMGKEGRALNVSGRVFQGKVKLSEYALQKTTNYRGQTRNHLLEQVCGFRMGTKTPHTMDLLDCFTYGVAISLGNSDGY